jgi:site-specific recombinase XerD
MPAVAGGVGYILAKERGTLHVNRVKGGTSATHYLNGSETRAVRALRRENDKSRFVFVSERGDVVMTRWFRNMVAKTGELAKLPFPLHPHMLRHACGFKFANEGKDTRSLQGYLGHRNIQSTTVYMALSPDRFKGWEVE